MSAPRLSRRSAMIVMVTALALTGCADASGPKPSHPDARVTNAPHLSATPAGTLAPVGTPSTARGRHADPDLEAMLPRTLGGAVLTRESQRGSELGTRSEALEAFLADLGRSLEDFSLASAYGGGELKAEVGAWRVRGADPTRLLDGFVGAVQASSATPVSVTPMRLAGRAVTRIGSEGELARGSLYAYVLDEVILFVQSPQQALAEEAIGKLPAPPSPSAS